MKKVDHFKYLGMVVSADGSCKEEIQKKDTGRIAKLEESIWSTL